MSPLHFYVPFFGYMHAVLHRTQQLYRAVLRDVGPHGVRGKPTARASRCWSRKLLSVTAHS